MRKLFLFLSFSFLNGLMFAQLPEKEYLRLATEKFNEGKYFEAIDFLEQVLQADSVSEGALLLRGRALIQLGRYTLAVNDLTEALKNRKIPDDKMAEILLYRGIAQMENRNLIEAEADLKMAMEIKPNNPEAYYELSKLRFMSLNDKSEAIQMLDFAIMIDPSKARYFQRRAEYKAIQAHIGTKNEEWIESGIRDLTFAISLEPGNYDLYRLRSELNKDLGKPEQAIEDYNKMIELQPDRYLAYQERGFIEMQSDRYVEAIRDFSMSIELHPDDEKNYRLRGLCLYNSRDFKRAYEDYSLAIQLLTEELKNADDEKTITRILSDVHVKRGVASVSMGHNGCDDFRKAYELGAHRGWVYYKKYCGF